MNETVLFQSDGFLAGVTFLADGGISCRIVFGELTQERRDEILSFMRKTVKVVLFTDPIKAASVKIEPIRELKQKLTDSQKVRQLKREYALKTGLDPDEYYKTYMRSEIAKAAAEVQSLDDGVTEF